MKVNIGTRTLDFPDDMSTQEVSELLDATFEAKGDEIGEKMLEVMAGIAQSLSKVTQEQTAAMGKIVQGLPDMEPIVKSMERQSAGTQKMLAVITERLSRIPNVEMPDNSDAMENLSTSLKEMSKKPKSLDIRRDKNGLLEGVTPVY